IESFSGDKAGVDELGRYVGARLQGVGATVEFRRQEDVGDHLVARLGDGRSQVLVLGHLDTIWPPGTLETSPFRVERGRAYGPGIFDMKSGIAIAIHALKSLAQSGRLRNRRVTVLLTSDEEIGCGTSRALIEELARQSEFVLCMEAPLGPDGALKTSRKALGIFRIRVQGRASHAGNDHQRGISAVEELAHQILRLSQLTDYEQGTTITVGKMSGGVVGNQVAGDAEALGDFRAASKEEEGRVVRAIEGLTPVLPGARVHASAEVNRPLMKPSPESRRLFRRAQDAAAGIGMTLTEASAGGGSDAQFAAALGVAVLDGLGCPGDGMFTDEEHVVVADLPRRVALLESILAEVEI
ncbi:MAG: M20 family metallopeptidase, partial [Dehalococcoidia bacterium]|nr:M20 family metallopeptidase [Dehalococcoidia bacterium]